MAGPYLNSGETIILTTNRVSADAVTYDIMLTTERIFLIDNRSDRFEPQIIPLSTILSVQGGKTPALEPVITLLFRSGLNKDTRHPLNLVFFQNPAENRKPERDNWIRNIIQLSINQHDREPAPETPVIADTAGDTGLRPSVRHNIAPEMVRPLSNVADPWTRAPAVAVIPDEVEGSGEIPARTPAGTPDNGMSLSLEPAAVEYPPTPVRGSQPRRTDPPARVTFPQITEEVLPVPAEAVPPGEQKEPAPPDGTETRDYTLEAPVRSMVATEKPAPEPGQDLELITVPAESPATTGPEQAPALPPPVNESLSMAEITGERESVPEPPTDKDQPAAPAGLPGKNGLEQALPLPSGKIVSPMVTGITEDLQPAPAGAVIPVEREKPAPPEEAGAQGHPRHVAASLTPIADGPSPESLPDTEPFVIPVVPGARTGLEQTVPVPPPAVTRPREIAEIIRAMRYGAGESPAQERTAPAMPAPEPDQVREIADTRTSERPESASLPAREAVFMKGPSPEDPPPIQQPAPPERGKPPFRTMLFAAAVLLLIIALVAAGAMLLFQQGVGQPATSVSISPTVVKVTTPPVQTFLPVTVPSSGVISVAITSAAVPAATPVPSLSPSPAFMTGLWVRVNSTASYIGRVGNAGTMQQISGTGDYFYKIPRNDRPVQVSVQKQDNSGALLAVSIYRNGTLIGARSVTSPMGNVDLLIDPLTARVPGLNGNDTLPVPTGTTAVLENY